MDADRLITMSALTFLWSLGVLLALDVATTVYLLARPGSKEGNRRALWFIEKLGGPRTGLIVAKAAQLAFFVWLAQQPLPVWALYLFLAIAAVPPAWNGYRIVKLGSRT
jgi:hypothetical protein